MKLWIPRSALPLLAWLTLQAGVNAGWAQVAPTGVSVLTQHNDPSRTGANLRETLLTPSSVRQQGFGKLFSRTVDGQIYAQPLVVTGVEIPGKGVRNVVYVATMRNNVYAFDAEGGEDAPFWKTRLGTPLPYNQVPFGVGGLVGLYNIRPFIGVTSTPVIDPVSRRMWAVAKISEPGQRLTHRMFVLDITTGAILKKADVNIPNPDEDPGELARHHVQRAGLLRANGMIYVAFGSQTEVLPYWGWLLAFDQETLELKHSFCATPGGLQGGIWQSGNGPAADSEGNVYIMTSDGNYDPGQSQYANSFVKLSPEFSQIDWFTPSNVDKLNLLDIDLGSGGPMLLPDSLGVQEMVGAGKEGKMYLVSRTSLGHQQRKNGPPIQSFQASRRWALTWLSWLPFFYFTGYHHVHGSPVFWQSRSAGPLIYIWPEDDNLKAFKYDPNTKLNRKPMVGMRNAKGMPGGFLSISANGPDNGLLWAAMPLEGDAFLQTVPGVLRVFDANTLEMLWSTDKNEPDDRFSFAKYVPPTVANGKVYLATFSDRLNVYGLSSPFAIPAVEPAPGAMKKARKRKNVPHRRP